MYSELYDVEWVDLDPDDPDTDDWDASGPYGFELEVRWDAEGWGERLTAGMCMAPWGPRERRQRTAGTVAGHRVSIGLGTTPRRLWTVWRRATGPGCWSMVIRSKKPGRLLRSLEASHLNTGATGAEAVAW